MANKKKKLNGFQLRQHNQQKKNNIKKKLENDILDRRQADRLNVQQITNGYHKINQAGLDTLKPLPYISYLSNLPEDIRPRLNEFIDNNPILDRGCWYNATKLQLVIPEVSIVHGYYRLADYQKMNRFMSKPHNREKLEQEMDFRESILRPLMNKNGIAILKPKHRYYDAVDKIYQNSTTTHGVNQPFAFMFCKRTNQWEVLERHTWNIYNGIHFDIGNPFMKKEHNTLDWIDYFTLDIPTIYLGDNNDKALIEEWLLEQTSSMHNINYHSQNENHQRYHTN